MKMKNLLAFSVFAVAASVYADGTPLAPGQTLNAVSQTFVGGLTLLDSRTDVLTGIDNSINLLRYEAELRSSVYRNAQGTLSFGYELYSFYPGTANLDLLSIAGLAPYSLSVEQGIARPDDGYFASGGASRLANGNEVAFLLRDNGVAGTGSIAYDQRLVGQIIHTDATSYGFGTASSVGGIAATSTTTLIPTGAPVPEPATMAALGLGSLAFLRRRKA